MTRWRTLTALTFALLGAVPALAAPPSTSVFGNWTDANGDSDGFAQTGTGLIAGSSTGTLPNSKVSSTATADFGLLKVGAVASLTVADLYDMPSAGASANFTDGFTAAAGDPIGFATISFALSGALTATGGSGDSRAGVNLRLRSADGLSSAGPQLLAMINSDPVAGVTTTVTRDEWWQVAGGDWTTVNTVGGDLFGTLTWTFGFDASQPWTIDASLGCLASVSGTNAVDCDLAHSFVWQGMTFAGPGGAAVGGVQLVSVSGRNYGVPYAAVVPEPTAWVLLVTGFGLVGAVTRRRVRRPA